MVQRRAGFSVQALAPKTLAGSGASSYLGSPSASVIFLRPGYTMSRSTARCAVAVRLVVAMLRCNMAAWQHSNRCGRNLSCLLLHLQCLDGHLQQLIYEDTAPAGSSSILPSVSVRMRLKTVVNCFVVVSTVLSTFSAKQLCQNSCQQLSKLLRNRMFRGPCAGLRQLWWRPPSDPLLPSRAAGSGCTRRHRGQPGRSPPVPRSGRLVTGPRFPAPAPVQVRPARLLPSGRNPWLPG